MTIQAVLGTHHFSGMPHTACKVPQFWVHACAHVCEWCGGVRVCVCVT